MLWRCYCKLYSKIKIIRQAILFYRQALRFKVWQPSGKASVFSMIKFTSLKCQAQEEFEISENKKIPHTGDSDTLLNTFLLRDNHKNKNTLKQIFG